MAFRLDRLHIEVTNVCNFKCEFCPDAIMKRRRGHMDLALLEKILDQVAVHRLARIITFHLMGEPMIYPHIFEAMAMARDRGLDLHLTTNGSTFDLRRDHIDKLIAADIPKVTISLQTPNAESFILRGAPPKLQPKHYFDSIIRYVKANSAAAVSTRVHIKLLDTTPNPFLVPHKPMHIVEGKAQIQAELWRWAETFLSDDNAEKDWSGDHLLQHRIANHKPGRWQLVELHPRLFLETFPLDSWGNVESSEVISARFGYCNGASQQAGILYDGTVVPCCKDYEGHIPLGNVTETPLPSIFNGPAACGLRQGFDRLQVTHPICQRCMGADTPAKAVLRQVGSVGYFKLYHPLKKRLDPQWGEV
ncbi:MAG: radical SAM/SPASM domain-containing protein [Cyanobacteria bacterium P01_H01_bin.119]